jgi:predicted oxidoreductase
LGAISEGPYFAVKRGAGDIGAAQGLQTNEHAQVLNAQGQVIGGLYAVGNDMNSIMGGVYPAPGITLGPGLVFANLAVQNALAGTR